MIAIRKREKSGYVVVDHVTRFNYRFKTKAEAEQKLAELQAERSGEPVKVEPKKAEGKPDPDKKEQDNTKNPDPKK